jgi:hypothetical protein
VSSPDEQRDRSEAINHLLKARTEVYRLSQEAAIQAFGPPETRLTAGQGELMGVYLDISQAVELLERWGS